MYHLAAYFASVGSVANTDVAALSDDILFIQNGHFVAPYPINLLWAYAGAATITRARINSPKLRQISPVYVRPISVSLLPPTNPNLFWAGDQPLRLNQNEEIALEITDGTGTSENLYGLIALGDVPGVVPAGDIYNVRFTHATTVTASKWSTISVTYEQQFPVGIYAVIGAEYFSTTAIAHRLIFDQQWQRPGFISGQTAGSRQPYDFATRDLGVWGQFSTTSLPRWQVLCNAADTSGEGYMQIIKVA